MSKEVIAHCPKCHRPAYHVQLENGQFVCKTCLARDEVVWIKDGKK